MTDNLASILRTIQTYRDLSGNGQEQRALREMAEHVDLFDLVPSALPTHAGPLRWKHGVSWLPVQKQLAFNVDVDHCTDCFSPITPAALYVSLMAGPMCRACTERRHPGSTVDA